MSADVEARLLSIVESIRELSPSQRRRLVRRLRISGLLEPAERLTDRGRLQIAPALAYRVPAPPEEEAGVPPPAASTLVRPEPDEPQAPEAATAPAQPDYRTPVSGKVVVGSPAEKSPASPHEMAPLPGQAPEQPIVIIFDGGSRGNPGQGYGSYALRWPGASQQIVRLRFGDKVTNNEAEYDTLIAALEAVLQRLADNRARSNTARLDIRGDSALVINQVLGEWECKEPRLKVRCDRVRSLLKRFGQWTLTHHRREKSVDVLGH